MTGRGMTGGGMTVPDLGQWNVITVSGTEVGYENATLGLSAQYDTMGMNPTLTASSPMHQPTVTGTWRGMWDGYVDGNRDGGPARVDVTIQGSAVSATLNYSGIDGVPGLTSATSAPASVIDGRFAPSVTVIVAGQSLTYSGQGQFGGTEQRGVVGYMSGDGLRSVFYGTRN